jgi:hypothetical protein
LEESRVETLHHRSPEVAKCETPKSRNRHINKEFHRPGNNSISEFRIPGVGGVKSRDSSSQESRSHEMRNAEIPKTETSTKSYQTVEITPFRSFRYRELECRNTSPQECRKCRNAEMRKTLFGVGFGYRELECRNTSPQECRNAEMPKSKCRKRDYCESRKTRREKRRNPVRVRLRKEGIRL